MVWRRQRRLPDFKSVASSHPRIPNSPPDTPLIAISLTINGATVIVSPASGAPISTAGSGATVTYTTDNMIEYGGGVFIGMNILSLTQSAAGTPLSFLGAPGCQAYVNTLDFTQAMVGFTASQSVSFTVPAGLPSGFEVYSQSVNLVVPNSLPNGQNAFGMTTSDGVVTRISSF